MDLYRILYDKGIYNEKEILARGACFDALRLACGLLRRKYTGIFDRSAHGCTDCRADRCTHRRTDRSTHGDPHGRAHTGAGK